MPDEERRELSRIEALIARGKMCTYGGLVPFSECPLVSRHVQELRTEVLADGPYAYGVFVNGIHGDWHLVSRWRKDEKDAAEQLCRDANNQSQAMGSDARYCVMPLEGEGDTQSG